ncbi:MAG: ribosome maturation factor RimM [bacterium]
MTGLHSFISAPKQNLTASPDKSHSEAVIGLHFASGGGRKRSLKTIADRSTDNYTVLGEITGHYGVKGWVKIKSFTRPAEQIFDYSEWYLSGSESKRIRQSWVVPVRLGPMRLKSWQARGKSLVACFSGIESRSEAEEIIGKSIEIQEHALPALDPGEFYWSQLIGLRVINTEGVDLGQVDHLVETGANDVLVVNEVDVDSDADAIERLLPWTAQVVIGVDLDQGTILVDWDAEF